jgi:hypothetical protein
MLLIVELGFTRRSANATPAALPWGALERRLDGLVDFETAQIGAQRFRAHPLSDQGALELGKDAHHLNHRLSRWRRCVEALQIQIESAPALWRSSGADRRDGGASQGTHRLHRPDLDMPPPVR